MKFRTLKVFEKHASSGKKSMQGFLAKNTNTPAAAAGCLLPPPDLFAQFFGFCFPFDAFFGLLVFRDGVSSPPSSLSLQAQSYTFESDENNNDNKKR